MNETTDNKIHPMRPSNTPKIFEEFAGMSTDQIIALIEKRQKAQGIDIDKKRESLMMRLEEESRLLKRETALSPAQLLVLFDI